MGILLGILAATVWGIAGVAGGLGARRVGAHRAIAWSMMLGLLLALPLALASGAPGRIDVRTVLWLLLVSAGMLGGLVCVYQGMRLGSIAVVASISATYGGVGAVLSIISGEQPSTITLIALGVAVVAAVLASQGETNVPGLVYANPNRAALLGAGAALLWGIQLWAGAQIGDDVGASWMVASARTVGVVVVALPLIARGAARIDRRTVPYLLVAGFGEVCGMTLFVLSSAYGVAQAAVLTSQYGAVAAIIGVVVLKERLRAIQLIGIVIILLAVVLMSVTD